MKWRFLMLSLSTYRYLLTAGLICSFMFLLGCGKGKEIGRKPIGKIVDVKAVSKSFGLPKVQIWTEHQFILVSGVMSVPFGIESFTVDFDSGCQFFTWEGAGYLYPINDEAFKYTGWYGNPVNLSPVTSEIPGRGR